MTKTFNVLSCYKTYELYSMYKSRYKLYIPIERRKDSEGIIREYAGIGGLIFIDPSDCWDFRTNLGSRFYLQVWVNERGEPHVISCEELYEVQKKLNDEYRMRVLGLPPAADIEPEEPALYRPKIGDQVTVEVAPGVTQDGYVERLKGGGRIRVGLSNRFLDVPAAMVKFRALRQAG